MTQPELAKLGKPRTVVMVLAIVLAAFLPAAYLMARPFLAAAVLAAILAVALDPIHSRIVRLVRNPSIAALLTTFVVVGPVLTAFVFGGMAVSREIRSGALAGILRASERLTGHPTFDVHSIEQALPQINRIAGGFFTCVFAAVFLYVLLVRGKAWVAQTMALVPLEAPVTQRILAAVRDSIVANVDGILAMAAVEAILYGAIFRAADMASPAMWGAFAGLASMIPLIGAAAVWLPLTITVAVHGDWVKASLFCIVCLAAQQAVALWLVPRMIGTRLRQPTLLIALSILGASSVFGALGILVGPVIVAILGALVHELRIQLHPHTAAEVDTRG